MNAAHSVLDADCNGSETKTSSAWIVCGRAETTLMPFSCCGVLSGELKLETKCLSQIGLQLSNLILSTQRFFRGETPRLCGKRCPLPFATPRAPSGRVAKLVVAQRHSLIFRTDDWRYSPHILKFKVRLVRNDMRQKRPLSFHKTTWPPLC